ncbi:MAG: hypothetical protein JXA25_19355 [Anaerolineales bacterium]|nr:hypothetical protein [Anaerolineales bacterium]
MNLLLFSGFLGSGKTTLVLRVVQYALEKDIKVAILVNEIGEVGIDNQLMRQLDMNVWELLGGCICCTLSADLVSTLEQLDRDYSPDLVLIEPSGAADPRSILRALPYYKGTPFESQISVSILDPLRLEMLYAVMTPLILSHIKHADFVLVSKCDLAEEKQIAFARRISLENNPEASIFNFDPDTPLDVLMEKIAPWMD